MQIMLFSLFSPPCLLQCGVDAFGHDSSDLTVSALTSAPVSCLPVYAMVSAARPDLQLVSLSRVFGLSSLRSTAEVAVISLLGSTP